MIHAFRLGGYNIVLDAASGSIHSVDEVAFHAICMLEGLGQGEVRGLLKAKFHDLSDDDISGLFLEIDDLRCQKKLFSPDNYAGLIKKEEPTLKALCMNVSHICNMRCSYCFADRGEYGGKEGLMSLETGKRAIDFLVENSGGRKNLDVDFFGGEPLLNWAVVKDVVGYARQIERGGRKKFRFTLTTNALLIDDEVINFTGREMHNVVLSIDGRQEVNDACRLLPDGSGSYADVLPRIKKITDARRGKGYYIRGTFTSRNKDFVNDILHIADLGFKELSLEPAVSKPGLDFGFTKHDLPELFRQYEVLAIEMLRRSKIGSGFSFYHFNLDLTGGPCVHKRIAGCGVGTQYLAVTPEGKLYPCHQFIGDRAFELGDVRHGITNKGLRDEFNSWDIYTRPKCRGCWARLYCSGGCAANAYNDTGSIGDVYELGCELFKKRLECAIMIKVAGA